ncbi:DUF4037 domain-containing protein [Bifidobacterium sp. ESL0690]|uniref:DUF4037 domain-containing protein n=1 Tax=Bifidobacterium sp. ESL0690 TaxID=2983214 RepID=UPI0023F95100|nr:DUF4037 domain-containing protein [Bifidobacterium sp. ESL0690]WEV47228.1 DUF4037 domain-containing protein [Bifidobacterium sp. ESL0690]
MDDNAQDKTPEELLRAFSEEHASLSGQPDDASDPNNAAAPTPSVNATFDTDEFLKGLDALFDAHEARDKAEPYLKQAMVDAENAGDDAGLLTVLNETMGFYRSHGRHEDNQWVIQRALELGLKMGIEGTEAWTTTLINAATGMRAAKHYDQAEDLYKQALASAQKTLAPTDRRMAALHNNISMLYSETGKLKEAQAELEKALSILEDSSTDPETDIDVASTHTNLALVLLQRATEAAQGGQRTSTSSFQNTSDSVSAKAEKPADSAPQSTQSASISEQWQNQPESDNSASSETVDSLLKQAMKHSSKTLEIYKNGHLEHSAHFASALAGYAQTCFAAGLFDKAIESYRQALKVIEECYGTDTDYYRITAGNLAQVEETARAARGAVGNTGKSESNNDADIIQDENAKTSESDNSTYQGRNANRTGNSHTGPDSGKQAKNDTLATSNNNESPSAANNAGVEIKPAISGLKLARAYWEQYGKPMIAEKYPDYQGRIAAGLIGHGSECYGFDDQYSQDHDFGPGFCLWLTDEDYAAIGEKLQADYEALPQEFMGFGPRESTARAQGGARRTGIFRIGDFFAGITGYPAAPSDDKPHEWLLLDEPTLAAATNGEIFADPLGAISKTRQGFKLMPDDVRLSLISRRLGMIAQAGQYNLPRMLKRGDGAAAWLSIREFTTNVCSFVFLINEPIRAGYMPYYKWQFAALRRLSGRMSTVLPDVCEQLETILRLSSAACFGGAGFGEGGKGSAPAQGQIQSTVEHICSEIVAELKNEGLTNSDEEFLEWQRPYVEAHIGSDNPVLHSL